MATASITYDYDRFYYNNYKYGIDTLNTKNSGEYLSPPVSDIDYFAYIKFNKTVPHLKSIKFHYTEWSNSTNILTRTHGLYIRSSNSWSRVGTFSMTAKASDYSEFSYMAEYDVNFTVGINNVTEFCILPTSMPNGSYTWSSTVNTGEGRLTITESVTDIVFEDSNYMINIINNAYSPRSESSNVYDTLQDIIKKTMPKVVSVSIENEIIDGTEIYVNIDGTVKKISENALVSTINHSWSNLKYIDELVVSSFIAKTNSYGLKYTVNKSDNSYLDDCYCINSSTNDKIYFESRPGYNDYILKNLIPGTKYYIAYNLYDSDNNDTSLSINTLLYPLYDNESIIEQIIAPTGVTSELSFKETSTMRRNQNKVIKLNVPSIPKNTYFMMYGIKYGSTNVDGYLAIYDKDGIQIKACDDNNSGWVSLQSSHPQLYAKSSYINRDPLIITDKVLNNGPFYIEYRPLSLSDTTIINYNVEWGSL